MGFSFTLQPQGGWELEEELVDEGERGIDGLLDDTRVEGPWRKGE